METPLAILSKHTWLVILHASRVPPHVGLMVNGNYNSLTIKGHELGVKTETLLKMISQRRMESVFMQLEKHPVFSEDHLREIFQCQVQQFPAVKQGEATCLSPLKLFLQEFYALPLLQDELLYELVARLEKNDYIRRQIFLNIDERVLKNGKFSLPEYTAEQLQETIRKERSAYYTD